MITREKREIIYSIAIIIIIPILLAFNTLLVLKNDRKSFDTELRRKADTVNNVIAEAARTHLQDTNQTELKKLIDNLQASQPSIKKIAIYKVDKSEKTAITSSDDMPAELDNVQELQTQIVLSRKQSVANRTDARTNDGKATQSWTVTSPLIDENGSVIAMVSSSLLTTDADEQAAKTLTTSFIVVSISIIAIIVLLSHHFRFVTYADLLQRQKEVNQTMSDFLSVATHELKAPMSIIKGYISITIDGTFGDIPPEAKEQLTIAINQTDRLNSLVQDLLNVSRIDQGKLTIDMKPTNATDIIASLIANYQQKADEKNLKVLYTQHPDQAVGIQADPGRFQEIMTNLIDNAVKYTETGTVTIGHRLENGFVVTTVQDTGHGMSKEEQARLFQRFYRVKNDHTKNISGTGLGLWIIKQYAEKMGGKIEVNSIVGTGTEFSVYLKPTTLPQPLPQQHSS